MSKTTLIEGRELEPRLEDVAILVVDCRFDLHDTAWGEQAYARGHVPGAVYAHLDRDLSGPKTGRNGRHPLPDAAVAAATFGRLGIQAGTQVIAYDQDSGMYASRLWWMLRWLGHDRVAVLNGGFAKWTAEGRTTRAGVETRGAATFHAHMRPDMLVTASDIADVASHASPGWQLLDARAPERYRGDIEPLDAVAGHIPGARNRFFEANLEGGAFRPAEQLAAEFEGMLGRVAADRVISYCGSGVTACHNLLAMEHAGLHGAKLYAGSWSEWSADPARGIETGEV